jgi:hypothetical protein
VILEWCALFHSDAVEPESINQVPRQLCARTRDIDTIATVQPHHTTNPKGRQIYEHRNNGSETSK